jgi:hypothetical protein
MASHRIPKFLGEALTAHLGIEGLEVCLGANPNKQFGARETRAKALAYCMLFRKQQPLSYGRTT